MIVFKQPLLSISTDFFVGQKTLSKNYFKEGYTIAAGCGYLEIKWPSLGPVETLYKRITNENGVADFSTCQELRENDIRPGLFHPPGFAILIAGIHRVTHGPSDIPLQIIGAILDSLAAVILFLFLCYFVNRNLSFVSALLYSIFPPLAYYSTVSKLPTGYLSFFMICGLYCLFRGISDRDNKWYHWALLAGVMIGLSSYIRSGTILFTVFLFIPFWIYSRNLKHSAKVTFVATVVVYLILTPWALRNYKATGKWIFGSTAMGMTMVTGLAEYKNPWELEYKDRARVEEANERGFLSPDTVEANSYFKMRFIEYVSDDPVAFLKIMMLRLPMVIATPYDWGYKNLFATKGIHSFRNEGKDRYKALFFNTEYVVLAFWHRMIMALFNPLSFWGLFLLNRQRIINIRDTVLLISPFAYLPCVHAIIHLEARFILPAISPLFVGVAYLLYVIYAKITSSYQVADRNSHSQERDLLRNPDSGDKDLV